MKLAGFVAIALWSSLCMGQQVHVSEAKSGVVLSVSAQRPYQLIAGEIKTPMLGVECDQKGKKTAHLLRFQPGSAIAEGSPESSGQRLFNMTVSGITHTTPWVQYGDTVTFAYFSKNEAERLKFIQSVLSSGTVSIEFIPFLTGATTTAVFDVSKLRDEMNKYPECATQ